MTFAAPTRVVVLAACLSSTAALGAIGLLPEQVPPGRSLASLPMALGSWSGQTAVPIPGDVVATLGVDDYVNRVYADANGHELAVYVGYYRSQRQGDAIHSPLNCLPGAGWQVVSRERATVRFAGGRGPIAVNQFTIRKGIDEQVVLYWYQSRGRAVANEYASKAFLVWDAIWHRRSDAALVRVITPDVTADAPAGVAAARAIEFVQALYPALEALLPS